MTAPRVNSALLASYIDQNIRLVGKVSSIIDGKVTLETSDQRYVPINSRIISAGAPDMQDVYVVGNVVEVVGAVRSDGTIEEFNALNFGKDFDLNNYNKLVELIHGKYSPLFLPDQKPQVV
jgi:hypothetical protein